ncbi:ribosome maturation factor RimM [Caldalkalibacillus salinus]|uniref:ribosome maturation factor RimM n=1 Tax=Caldalkalibacillus salinus TaxID=2803787 RepID=UPI001923C943|nr:ribosome maturation factor RimM [Caldalkalibacillus salinus]
MTKFYKVGKIVNTHGVRGEVRVVTTSDFAEERYQPGKRLFYFTGGQNQDQEGVPLVIKSYRQHKSFDLLSFEDHPSINDVEGYKGGFLKVAEDDRETLEEGEYYYDQIIGCDVLTEEGDILGTVKEILSPGANDVWVIKRKERGKDVLIPYIDDVVKSIDVEHKQIVVTLIEGLVDEE